MIFDMMHGRARRATGELRSGYGRFASSVAQVQQVPANFFIRIRPKCWFRRVARAVWCDRCESTARAKCIEKHNKYRLFEGPVGRWEVINCISATVPKRSAYPLQLIIEELAGTGLALNPKHGGRGWGAYFFQDWTERI